MKLQEHISGRPFALLLCLLVVSGGLVGVAAADSIGASQLNTSSDYVPNPEVPEQTLEKETHHMGEMSLLEYEGDNGEIKELDGRLNESVDNPISLRADLINATDYRNGFGQNGGSAINASLWSVSGANSSKGSVSASSTPAGVESVQFATDGSMGSGDRVVYEFDAGVDQDAAKRVGQLVANINTLDSGTSVEVIATDGDGDDKVAAINSSANADAKDVIANATGNGIVWQHKLGDLTTEDVSETPSGDGSFDSIDRVLVVVEDGDVSMNAAGMNFEKLGTWSFGERMEDTDSDDDLESVTVSEPSGYYSVSALDTLGSTFDSATAHSVRFPVNYTAGDLEDSDLNFTVSETPEGKYPGYSNQVDAYYRLSVPNAYDLIHSGLALEDEQKMPSSRYKTVEVAEGVGDTQFTEISSWTDVTGSYSSEGSTITLDSTVEPGKEYAVHYEYVATDSNVDEMKQSQSVAVGGGKEGNGGIFGSIAAVIASVLSVVGLGKVGQKLTG